jgi:hypothetical protein
MLVRAIKVFAIAAYVIIGLPRAVTAQEQADIIILFDQSGSVGKHDPKLASKAWLLTFLKTFDNPYKIEIIGFDEALYRHLSVDRDTASNIDAVNQAIDGIAMVGLATNLEMPFRYLLNYAKPSTKLAVLISDGEPEIWDGKLGYLSQEVQGDIRYDDLNRQYRQMRDAGVSKRKRFEKLGALYQTRNIELINGQLPGVAKLTGDRLIIWDLSGSSAYLQNWAKIAGAQYLPMRVAAKENPIEQLQKAMTVLQQHSSAIVNEALPRDHERRAADALTSIPEIADKVLPKEEPAPEPPSQPVEIKAPQPAPEPASQPAQQPAQQPAAPPPDAQFPSWLTALLLLASAVGAYAFFRWRTRKEMAEPLDSAASYIDAEVKRALDDAEKLRRKLLVSESSKINVERRFSLRVAVPPGAMNVQWVNEDGQKRETPAINISMHGVKFETEDSKVASVKRIICPKMDVALGVIKSQMVRCDEASAVAMLVH